MSLARVFFGTGAVAALVASGVLLILGDVRGAAAAIVVAASALTFLSTARTRFRWPRGSWLGFGLLGSGLVILGFPPATVVIGLAGLFVLQLVATAVVVHRVGRITFERLDHAAIMPGAEALAQQFVVEGFRVAGGYGCRIGGKRVLLTVMIGPQRDRLAVVTDKVWYVVSRFGQRTLVTGSSGAAPVPPGVLRQQIADGSPAELLHAHNAALTIVSGRMIRPDVFDTDEHALDAVLEHEERAVAFMGRAPVANALRMETGRPTRAMLSGDPDDQKRVDEWLKA